MTGIAAVLITFSLYVLTHWVVCRTTRRWSHSWVINLIWLGFLPMYLLLLWALSHSCTALAVDFTTPNGVADLLNGLLWDVLLLLGYTYFFWLIERGLSLRVMIEIGRSPRRQLTIPEIQQIYTYDYIIKKRLNLMYKMGYAIEQDGRIRNTEKGRKLANANRLVRKIIRLKQVTP